jgi:predicted RNA-binding Zn-ribbon protein involved in translation (DUF1610 family)
MAAATVSEPNEWTCSGCGHHIHLAEAKKMLPACVLCGNHEIYKKKDFPHWLGMTILIVAVVLSTVTYYNYEKWWSWSFLIGSAIIDGVMYLLVGDVLVCYRCDAHYRGFTTSDAHQPFEIGVGERFRQERIRREQLKAERTQATVSGNRSNPT